MEEVISIEKYKGEDISFVNKEIIDALQKLSEKELTIIPVTTRTIEQFKRIDFKKFNINFEWAITNNGACILKRGQPLAEWQEYTKEKLANSEKLSSVLAKYEEYTKNNGILRTKIAEDLFFYSILDKKNFKLTELDHFAKYIENVGWKALFKWTKTLLYAKGHIKRKCSFVSFKKNRRR